MQVEKVATGSKLEKGLLDRRARRLRDLRVSVTDRCNFRCPYCMPRDVFTAAHRFAPHDRLLTFEEIQLVVKVFAGHGVQKVRLTGGEPLLRSQLPTLVRMLREIRGIELALTTNGALLSRYAQPLADAGLQRVTVSLDALDPDTFRRMSDSEVSVGDVLAGIEAARRAGLAPLKINTVVRRSVNTHAILDLARYFRGTGTVLRFIEFMDVGNSNGWRTGEVVPAREILERIDAVFPLEPIQAGYSSEVAKRYRYRDGSGEIGVVASVSEPFCGDCSRARLSAEGLLYTCLFANQGVDLRSILRSRAAVMRDSQADSAALERAIADTWANRDDHYSEQRSEHGTLVKIRPKIEMSYIGG